MMTLHRLDRSVRRHGRQAHGREEGTHKRDEDDEARLPDSRVADDEEEAKEYEHAPVFSHVGTRTPLMVPRSWPPAIVVVE